VFPVLHGPRGEDGAIQGLLELAGIPYVGAGILGSALGMDKAMQKALWSAAGLPVVPHEVVHESDWRDDPEGVAARVQSLGYPVFTKPAALGSSVGITKVAGPGDLDAGIEEALRFGRKAVVERGIEPAREIECAVLGNDDPVASVCGEIVPHGHDFYDYDAKYLDEDGARLVIPAPLDGALTTSIQRLAVSAFTTVACAGMARVDMFVRDDDVWLNEINTIPGFTSISMYPKLWDASGLPYDQLVQRLLDLAVERFDAEQEKRVDVPQLHGRSDAGGRPGERRA
jgi:D-alanine-D-alanine ligase